MGSKPIAQEDIKAQVEKLNQVIENTDEKRKKRKAYEIESCFGDIKHNMGFRRLHLRGLQKVKAEITIVSMAHNLRKRHRQQAKQAV